MAVEWSSRKEIGEDCGCRSRSWPGVSAYFGNVLGYWHTDNNVLFSAENGCFTKEPETTKWKSSVSKLNFDWKPLCLEILAYVSLWGACSSAPWLLISFVAFMTSSLNVRPARLLKTVRPRWSGGS